MAKHRKTGNRVGGGGNGELEQSRRATAEIEQLLMGQALEAIRENKDFFDSLPPSTQAQFLHGRLGKPKDLDEDLQSQALSLSAALEQLQTIDDISQKACALAIHCRKVEALMEQQTLMMAECRMIAKRRGGTDPQLLINLIGRVQTVVNNYHLERKAALLSEEDIAKWVADAVKQ